VFHAFLGERLPDWQQAARVVRTIAENYKLPYFTLSPTYSICEDHGYITGEAEICPVCGKKVETYSRITGYYRPVSNWNAGKSQEFRDRKTYDMGQMIAKSGIGRMISSTGPMGVAASWKVDAVPSMNGMGHAVIQIVKSTDKPAKAQDTVAVASENFASGYMSAASSSALDIMLLTTSECPKCKMAESVMSKKGMKYTALTAEEGRGRELALRHGIMSAPAMLINEGTAQEQIITDFNEVLKYIS
jgi:ribonucleoside-triphosphate reductase